VDHLKKTLSSPIIKDFEKGLLEATSVRLLSIPYYGTRHVTTSRKAINSVDDLRNLKLRCPNEQMITTCWRAMGTSPTPMSLSEVYMALSQNAVDGQENPFPTIIAQKFYEVQRYIALTGHTVQTLPILINEKVYQNLPPEYRKVIDEVAVQCADRITQGIINAEAVQLDELKANGMTVTYPDVTPLRTAILEKVVPEYQAEWGKGLFEQIQAIR
jgi:TRAP-type C4-dicarboxylate transport system substrate-binding protein